MERTISFQCTPDELFELVKNAVRAVNSEHQNAAQAKSAKEELEVLSSKEVCRLLRVSAPTLIKLRREGKIKGKRLNGKILYKRSEVEKTLAPTPK
jgi:excisionase family DNA binding protein